MTTLDRIATIENTDPELSAVTDYFYIYIFESVEKGRYYKYSTTNLHQITDIVNDMKIKYNGCTLFFDDVLIEQGKLSDRSIEWLSEFLSNKFETPTHRRFESSAIEYLDL